MPNLDDPQRRDNSRRYDFCTDWAILDPNNVPKQDIYEQPTRGVITFLPRDENNSTLPLSSDYYIG